LRSPKGNLSLLDRVSSLYEDAPPIYLETSRHDEAPTQVT